MKALVCLSAPVFLETTGGPVNTIFLHVAKDRGYGLCLLVFQRATYHPEAPNPHRTRARGVDQGEAPGASSVVRQEGAQKRERCDGHDKGVNRRSLLVGLGQGSSSRWGRNLEISKLIDLLAGVGFARTLTTRPTAEHANRRPKCKAKKDSSGVILCWDWPMANSRMRGKNMRAHDQDIKLDNGSRLQ
jgi:hypothetical protein